MHFENHITHTVVESCSVSCNCVKGFEGSVVYCSSIEEDRAHNLLEALFPWFIKWIRHINWSAIKCQNSCFLPVVGQMTALTYVVDTLVGLVGSMASIMYAGR